MSGGISESRRLQSHSGGSAKDQGDSPNQPKSRSGSESLRLSRCAACYNQKLISKQGGDGESSSSAEDSGSEVDWESESESESESDSSSSGSVEALPQRLETETPSAESAGEDGDGREETSEDKSRTKETRRASLIKSFSLPTSFTPHLTRLSLLPRPHTVVSTLHLQVLSQQRDGDTFLLVKQHQPEEQQRKTEETNSQLPPRQQRPHPASQQHQLSYQHHQQLRHQRQQQRPPCFAPPSAQGQRLPPPLHSLPVLHPPTLHALAPQPCWCCYQMKFPHLCESWCFR